MTETEHGYSAAAVANAFLRAADRAGKRLSNLQLQKLVFISQGIALACLGRPMYRDETEAWKYGPVIPGIYHALKRYGADGVPSPIATEEVVPEDSKEAEIVQRVHGAYADMDPHDLVGLTHQGGSPWQEVRDKGMYYIPKELLQKRYGEMLDEYYKRKSTEEGAVQ